MGKRIWAILSLVGLVSATGPVASTSAAIPTGPTPQQSAQEQARVKPEKHQLELKREKQAASGKRAQSQGYMKFQKRKGEIKGANNQGYMKFQKREGEIKGANNQKMMKISKSQAVKSQSETQRKPQ